MFSRNAKCNKKNAGIRLLATDQCDGEPKLCACNDYVANSLRMFLEFSHTTSLGLGHRRGVIEMTWKIV